MKNWTQEMLPLKIIEDLGVIPPTETSVKKSRYMLFECPHCKESFRAEPSKVSSKTITRCRQCAIKTISAPSINNGYKECTVCNTSKPILDFYRNKRKREGYDSRCKSCADTYKSKWLDTTQVDIVEQRKNTKYLQRYGITLEEYNALNESQNGKCAICGNYPSEGRNKDSRLAVDHCHETGKIRGLLCQKCNTGIGLLGDTKESLLKALKYLENK